MKTDIRKIVNNPRWVVVITCQGQPHFYQYKNVIGACIGLIKNYLLKKKYGTMNFLLRQVK